MNTITPPPDHVTVPGIGRFGADVLPDPFDERDLEYRPRLALLPPKLSALDNGVPPYVMEQQGNSCTGHALAAVINIVLAQAPPAGGNGAGSPERVSPYMLYRLARRYDEFGGEDDVGSSLRGALKGWFHHGVLSASEWPDLDQFPEPDLYDLDVRERALRRPIGAYYRVNPRRIDDMQSAICELGAVCASASIHEGWLTPQPHDRDKETSSVIEYDAAADPVAGHAFALVGYNERGFLVQNSWGREWGRGGLAILTYDDWLRSCYDAWVLRTGVPMTPMAAVNQPTGRRRLAASGLSLPRLAMHVVNLGESGRLSKDGQFQSSPEQIERAFAHMAEYHRIWEADEPDLPRNVVLYAHGGMTNEGSGLRGAQANRNWWLNNRVYPLFFAWQSGPVETLLARLTGELDRIVPFGAAFDLQEQIDRRIEAHGGRFFRVLWDQMKRNAALASTDVTNPGLVSWPPSTLAEHQSMSAEPGATLTVLRLREYMRRHGNVKVHLVGHSAGANFHAGLLVQMTRLGIPVASLSLLAPALRVDEFESTILRNLGPGGTLDSFTTFALSDQRERDDSTGPYRKSILYLVSRALESRAAGEAEVPLLGMAKFFGRPLPSNPGVSLQKAIEAQGGTCVFSPVFAPEDARCNATSHGGFDGDVLTMTSIAMRIRGLSTPDSEALYQPNAPLLLGPNEPIFAGRP